ncbi:peptide ABC transporter ATP-binding protein [Burkholderia sp. PAMC 28687]|uniref:Oligopeptide transport system permease protein OppB n=1 Tax=Caballeronia sordidicola TaxID=196367 RepID=A0A242MUE2_CABSO|nr:MULTISPECIES: ABC transporter ATP-binding protein [Burkholderiaceae]AMM15151.1 peptide ABC transporter ATP-binding protein [Burkholderia sp. PAMC 28687]OTP74943.1 Oligopeptide transport system permease protein OppB [Caballeronia sordidicola]
MSTSNQPPLNQPTKIPVLEVSGFSLKFSRAVNVPNLVENVSFSVNAGETLCIVGESGCGKSVTSLAMMGLLPSPPANIVAGKALFDGRDLFKLTERELANIRGNRMSMIFQEPMTSLNPAFTIGHQIAECVQRHRGLKGAAARKEALEMLRLVRIPAPEKRLDAYPHELSGGMRQRVMIAMALANRPQLLIADEPTTALDVTIQAQVLLLVRNLQAETGTAMVLITHDLGVVAEVADHVAVMYAGRIVEYGSVDEIFDDPQHPYTIGLMGAIPSVGKREGALATIRGSVPSPEQMPKGCRFAPRCPFVEQRCIDQAPPDKTIDGSHRVACWVAPVETVALYDEAAA